MIRSRAPVRIDFSGGWTDVAEFCEDSPGAVCNAAINIYSYSSIEQHDTAAGEEPGVQIYSADFDLFVEADSIRKLEYDGQLDLVKAAIRHLNIERSFRISTRSDAPPGSGLGTSAAMGVALIGGLSLLTDQRFLGYEIAELASEIEREELHIRGGKQDHYGSALGGINFMEFNGEVVQTAELKVSHRTIFELEKHLILCYTGKSRLSGDIHQHVLDAYQRRDPDTMGAMTGIKNIAREMKRKLVEGDLSTFGELLDANWENQKRLHPSVTNEQIEDLFAVAKESGAIGGKACGAGGGGCLLFMAKPDREHVLRKALEKAGVTMINFNIDQRGLEICADKAHRS